MASAIPAAIGVGSSLIGSISSKGAQKKQQQLQEQQLAALKPLIQSQTQSAQFGNSYAQQLIPYAMTMLSDDRATADSLMGTALGNMNTSLTDYRKLLDDAISQRNDLYSTGKGLIGQGQNHLDAASPYLKGAGAALSDLSKFYRPFMEGGSSAIDRFLPGSKRTMEAFSPEFNQVNQAYGAASRNLAELAPRGPGRITASNDLEMKRQQGLSETFFKGRQALQDKSLTAAFQGASGQQSVAQALQALGGTEGSLGLNTIGAGLNSIGAGTQAYGTGGGLAQNAFSQGQNSLAQALQAAMQKMQVGNTFGSMGTNLLSGAQNAGGNIFDLYNRQADRSAATSTNNSAKNLGGYLVDLFSNKSVQDKISGGLKGLFGGGGSSNTFLTAPYNPYGNQLGDFAV